MENKLTTINRADLSQALSIWQPIQAEFDAPLRPVDMLAVYVLTAELLEWPLTSASITAQSGRFAVVSYTPIMGFDPDVMICLETSKYADTFHRIMRQFQAIRRKDVRNDPRSWYLAAREAAKNLAMPLWSLSPTRGEAAFVIRWALQVVATGSQVRDGIQEQRIFDTDKQYFEQSDLFMLSGWALNE